LDTGEFIQSLNPLQNGAQLDAYKRSIAEFTGAPSFFVAWREATDTPHSAINHTPNTISVWSNSTFDLFDFIVTTDQVELLRGDAGGSGTIITFNLQGSVFHSYYLALHSDLSYDWYIDGSLMNVGQFPSPYPDTSSGIEWGARCFSTDPPQNAKWDYIRYGVIPADHSGDFDSNGIVDANDLYFFVDCLLGPDYDAAGPGCKWADMNNDGKADGADVQLFAQAMLGV